MGMFARVVGNITVLTLCTIGALDVYRKISMWKEAAEAKAAS